MSQTPSFFQNSPVSGTTYTAPAAYGAIPNNATSVTCTVKAWSGANGTGSLVVVTNLTATIFNSTGSANVSSLTGGSVNTENVASSAGSNGTNILVPKGSYTNGSSIGSLEMFLVYTGNPVSIAHVFRSSAWAAALVDVDRSSVQTLATGVFVFRSSVWVRAT